MYNYLVASPVLSNIEFGTPVCQHALNDIYNIRKASYYSNFSDNWISVYIGFHLTLSMIAYLCNGVIFLLPHDSNHYYLLAKLNVSVIINNNFYLEILAAR